MGWLKLFRGARLALSGLLLLTACNALAAAEPRIALVIGNSAYESAPLKNPRNDATEMARLLEDKLGFEVRLVLDGNDEKIKRALAEFGRRLASGKGVGFFYFSGHGLRVGARNYLLPLGRRFDNEADVELFALDVQQVLSRMESADNRLNIVVLDACRDYPLARPARGSAKGLARIEAPPPGSVIAFATAAGATADDNPRDPNGLYTKHLLKHLAEPGRRLEDVFNAVAHDVWRESGKHQRPELLITLLDPEQPFYFLPSSLPSIVTGSRASGPAEPAPETASPVPGTQPASPTTLVSGTDDYPPGKTFRDCPDCPEMVVIPAGKFLMGSPKGEEGRDKDEGPQHRVAIGRSFAIGKYEVTFAEWDACVMVGGCRHKPEDESWRRGRRPVMKVSWQDAQDYIVWLSRKTGKGYRLPSEAEWEYAARAGTTTRYPWGPYPWGSEQGRKANFDISGSTSGSEETAPVGSFAANTFGLHDMAGNVYEWVQDCYHDSYRGAPADGSAWEGGACEFRVLRGGSLLNGPHGVRSASREWFPPSQRSDFNGFRIARTLP